MIQVGTGGFGGAWCKEFLPEAVESGLVEVIAAVDVNPAALINARESLGLAEDKLYTDVEKAFDENPADFCTVVVPPKSHEKIIDCGLAHDMHILCEKPIAHDLETSVRIVNKIEDAGKKMGITLSHRFAQDNSTFREAVRSGDYGDLDYILLHHTVAKREYASWGKFRSEIPDVQMVEGGVHYLDIMAEIAGAKCVEIYSQTWNPPWSEYKGDPQSMTMMSFENATRGFIEMSASTATSLYPWGEIHCRAECDKATIVLEDGRIERFPWRNPAEAGMNRFKRGQGIEIPLLEGDVWRHNLLIKKFTDWLAGGPEMETNVRDALQSSALFEAAIISSREGRPVKVQEYLQEVISKVSRSPMSAG
ncbi:Gfo/Idh/MocA family protein [Candidatus Poribacteria bacterium]